MTILCAALSCRMVVADEQPSDRRKLGSDSLLNNCAEIQWEQFFSPPIEYESRLGQYRSVLKFDDGSTVKTADEWRRRRGEIRNQWNELCGNWPPLLTTPRMRYLQATPVEGYTRHAVELEFAADEFSPTQYLLVPDGTGPFPAVIVTWYNAEDSAGLTPTTAGTLDFGHQLAKRGFVALCIGGLDGRPVREPIPKKSLQPLSFLAYAAANCHTVLSQLSYVSTDRIGIIGHSFGGKWAMFTSCLDDRFACAVWSDPGIVWNESDPNANYWEKWYLGYDFTKSAEQQRPAGLVNEQNLRTGSYARLVDAKHDLHELHALMAPRPFLVSGGAQDRPSHWEAMNHTVAVNNLLDYTNRVAMTMREGHQPTPESNQQTMCFLETHLARKPVRK